MSAQNYRIIEKDIFTAIPAGSAGDSQTIDLFGSSGGANRFSIQAIYDVQAPSAKTFDSGGAEVDTATFDTKANTGAGDYLVVYDTAGLAWALAANKTGSDPAPTGAIWVAIPAARKAQVDLSGATTAANVATAFADAFNLLTDVPITALAATADVSFTGDLYGAVTAPSVHNTGDTGAGSIVIVVTDAGVNSEVDVVNNSVTIPSHGYSTGLKGQLTATGTLPGGLATSTDYFIIYVDANTVKFATSQANALLGTAVNITNQGSDENVSTFTATSLSGASVTFKGSNDGTNFADLQAATSITVDGTTLLSQPNVAYRYFKATKALTAGQVDLKGLILVIGDAP